MDTKEDFLRAETHQKELDELLSLKESEIIAEFIAKRGLEAFQNLLIMAIDDYFSRGRVKIAVMEARRDEIDKADIIGRSFIQGEISAMVDDWTDELTETAGKLIDYKKVLATELLEVK